MKNCHIMAIQNVIKFKKTFGECFESVINSFYCILFFLSDASGHHHPLGGGEENQDAEKRTEEGSETEIG